VPFLAALGALGMMMSKGSKGKESDVDTSGVSDMDLTGGARSMPIDTGEIRAEDGSLSKLRRNTETGDLYSPNEPITRPSAPKARASSPRIGGYMSDSEQIARESKPRVTPDRVKNLASTFNVPMNPRIQRDELGEPLYKKKGGVIKMAKGGLASSASRRADGIASKGKTRGKIC
jgi:hypothetical protein